MRKRIALVGFVATNIFWLILLNQHDYGKITRIGNFHTPDSTPCPPPQLVDRNAPKIHKHHVFDFNEGIDSKPKNILDLDDYLKELEKVDFEKIQSRIDKQTKGILYGGSKEHGVHSHHSCVGQTFDKDESTGSSCMFQDICFDPEKGNFVYFQSSDEVIEEGYG